MRWISRAFGREDAARLIGISVGHLDVILHRNRDLRDLFSEKVGDRRLFSMQDIAVIRLAYLLERFGRTWLFAFGSALEFLEDPPPEDAVLVVTMGRSLPQPRRVIADRDIERLAVDESTLLIPIGKIVKSIKEAASVAIHD